MSLKNVYCRAYQVCFAVGARLLPWRRPECITGLGSFARVPSLLAERGVCKPLIVASRRQSQTPAFQEMLGHLAGWSLYTGVTANPRVETVEAIAAQYRRSGCDGFVAVGGGSPMYIQADFILLLHFFLQIQKLPLVKFFLYSPGIGKYNIFSSS